MPCKSDYLKNDDNDDGDYLGLFYENERYVETLKDAGSTILLLLTFLERNIFSNSTDNTFEICKNINRSMCLFQK